MTLAGDIPIRRAEDDALGRAPLAEAFAEDILAIDASEGVVVGVLGPWGSGKTSFVNLARQRLKAAGVEPLDFNPWMLSGAEQLVASFFIELASQLKMRPGLESVGKGLEDYGEAFSGLGWLPLVGPWIERGRVASKAIGKLLQRRKEGIGDRRTKLSNRLAELKQPIVVVLDDIDRLSTAEIRDIFKLVRLTASFPNVIYVLAFDRTRVETALEQQGVPGRDYLEKILQVAVDLPVVPHQVLTKEVLAAVDEALTGIEDAGLFDKEAWPDVFMEIIRPLLRHMRDVRRYASSVRGTVRGLDGQVALADVLALEAVRIFMPDVFAQLSDAREGLTSTTGLGASTSQERAQLKVPIDKLLEAAGERRDVVEALITRVFPAGSHYVGGSHYSADFARRWLRERRVAHPDILAIYLERVAGESLQAFTAAERAWTLLSERDALDTYLRSLDRNSLQDVVSSLENYEDEFREEHVVPATTVLLNLLPELPERQQGCLISTHVSSSHE
jgi:predicted KAP-like P-loop ATPase